MSIVLFLFYLIIKIEKFYETHLYIFDKNIYYSNHLLTLKDWQMKQLTKILIVSGIIGIFQFPIIHESVAKVITEDPHSYENKDISGYSLNVLNHKNLDSFLSYNVNTYFNKNSDNLANFSNLNQTSLYANIENFKSNVEQTKHWPEEYVLNMTTQEDEAQNKNTQNLSHLVANTVALDEKNTSTQDISSMVNNLKKNDVNQSHDKKSNTVELAQNELATSEPNVNNPPSEEPIVSDSQEKSVIANTSANLKNTPLKIMMVGDSVMGDIAFSMKRLAKKDTQWQVLDYHKVSSGLSNQEYYNWPKVFEQLSNDFKPDYVVMFLGTNDAQGMIDNKKGYAFRNDTWANIYSQRMQKMLDIAKAHNTKVIWIQLPRMEKSEFDSKIEYIESVQEKLITQQNDIPFVKVNDVFAPNGHYASNINVGTRSLSLRAPDGIHLSSEGANQVANKVMKVLLGSNN